MNTIHNSVPVVNLPLPLKWANHPLPPVERPDPAGPRLINICDDDLAAAEILLARFSAGLRSSVEQGSISQLEADRQIAKFKQALQRNPLEPDGLQQKHIALTRGNAEALRKAAEALEALNSGAPPSSIEIPPGVIIDPTLQQINEARREIGLKALKRMPKRGWRGPIFMSASKPKRAARFSDPGKESAVVGSILSGLFHEIPAQYLVPADAFTDDRWRIVYSVGLALRDTAGGVCCCEAVNDYIAFHQLDAEMQEAVDSTKTFSWKKWSEDVDMSSAYCERTAPLEYYLGEIAYLYGKRSAAALGAQMVEGELELDAAREKLEEILHGTKAGGGANGAKLTMMTVSQILAYEDDPTDILLSNGYIEKGSPCVLCGPPGIGKSRLALQLAVKSILGQGFLGWETRAQGLKWAFLQNENGLRRLKADLRVMAKDMSKQEMEALEKYLLIHAIVNDTDGHLDLSEPAARRRVIEVVQDWKPDIVLGDPLTAFGIGDLNSDQEMLRTARDFGRIVREGDPRRVPFLLHHARTGKEAKAGVAGADRASYARNSKALYGWTRSQLNVAAVNTDNNNKLLFASGKCNNAPEFEKFIIELELAAMFYARTDEDPDAAMEEMQGEDGKFKKKYDRKQILILMSSLTPLEQKNIKKEAIDRLHMSGRTFDTLWGQLKEFEEIEKNSDGKWLKK